MFNTFARPSRDLRNKYPELAQIVKERNQVIITNNGREESVLIGIDEFRQYEQFLHHQYIANELAKAKSEAGDPATKWLSHDEVWGKVKAKYEV